VPQAHNYVILCITDSLYIIRFDTHASLKNTFMIHYLSWVARVQTEKEIKIFISKKKNSVRHFTGRNFPATSSNEAGADNKTPSPSSSKPKQEKATERAADQGRRNPEAATSSTKRRANCINSGGYPGDGSNSNPSSGGGERASSVLLAMEGQNDQ
jgi:hypothetical protein